ncbi:hypothetical protein [Vibrio barjaei]|uniref:hypothetical protein n=1 Tax=Vibrio barjaei TaxID=1676683 RepID=UPI0022835FEC|nr:hypothetical protein [Vibrio barjaei]MCY9870438.1 hypothetical protein [Vibrio barjaei]
MSDKDIFSTTRQSRAFPFKKSITRTSLIAIVLLLITPYVPLPYDITIEPARNMSELLQHFILIVLLLMSLHFISNNIINNDKVPGSGGLRSLLFNGLYAGLAIWFVSEVEVKPINTSFIQDSEHKVTLAKACNIDSSECIEEVILVLGRPNDQAADNLANLLAHNASVDTVCMLNNEGNFSENLKIAQTIRGRKLNTCLADLYIDQNGQSIQSNLMPITQCHADCALTLLTGKQRTQLGSHNLMSIANAGGYVETILGRFILRDNTYSDEFEQLMMPTTASQITFLEMTRESAPQKPIFLSNHDKSLFFTDFI